MNMSVLRTTLIAGAAALSVAGFGMAPAFATWNPDPYTYDYSPAQGGSVMQAQPRADTCFIREAVHDRFGNVIGHRTVNVCDN
jgi:hypothetical protein